MQNAIQRSGRSGRTQNGCAIRLWSEESEKRMPQGIVPEVLQIEPSELILQKAALELDERGAWIELPTAIPEAREKTATALLENFGMLQDSAITELGLKAIRTPVSSIPLALLLASAKNKEDLPDLLLAALAWIHSGTEFLQKSKVAYDILTLASDTLSKSRDIPREVSFTLRQLRDYREKIASPTPQRCEAPTSDLIAHSLLKAFPDRLATPSGNAYKLANQNVIRLQVAEPPYAILALSMLRTGGGSKSELKVNLYAPIAKELLGGESAKTRYELLWRSGQERFIGVEISESENADGSTTELSRKEILTQEASPKVLEELKKLTVDAWREKIEKENWSGKFLTEAVQTQLIKMRLAAKLYPEYGLPEFNEEDMELIFDEFADGKFLLRDINEDRYRNIVEDYFGKSMLQWLGKTFPDHYVLPNGKRARYSYQEVAVSDDGKSVQSIEGVLVEISARIEDLMQLRGEHRIADGKLKVRYDILAPNFRTIQKTWDLTGFWQNTYAEVRKELRGRYPKHPWHEQVIQN
jgi:HrpA-like RNA helicase